MAALAPLASPTLHRPFRDPQHGSDLPVLPVSLEARHGLAPDPLSRVSLDVGQAAALRISHRTRTTEATFTLSGEQPDITRSSSVSTPETTGGSTSVTWPLPAGSWWRATSVMALRPTERCPSRGHGPSREQSVPRSRLNPRLRHEVGLGDSKDTGALLAVVAPDRVDQSSLRTTSKLSARSCVASLPWLCGHEEHARSRPTTRADLSVQRTEPGRPSVRRPDRRARSNRRSWPRRVDLFNRVQLRVEGGRWGISRLREPRRG